MARLHKWVSCDTRASDLKNAIQEVMDGYPFKYIVEFGGIMGDHMGVFVMAQDDGHNCMFDPTSSAWTDVKNKALRRGFGYVPGIPISELDNM